MTKEYFQMSVGRAIQNILPLGTVEYLETDDTELKPRGKSASPAAWMLPPAIPTDLFVTAAHVLHCSGLLNYFDPNPDFVAPKSDKLTFTLTSEQREACYQAGTAWSENPEAPSLVFKLWSTLSDTSWNKPIRASTYSQKSNRFSTSWWPVVLQLLIIADEACVGLGAPPDADHPNRWLVNSFQILSTNPFKSSAKIRAGAHRALRQPTTYGLETDPDVACVQPKGRISSVGCNLRNLTKNVSYIPHAGNLRCHWMQPIKSKTREDEEALDILILPFPMEIPETSFEPSPSAMPERHKRPNWGNFELTQSWLSDRSAVVEYAVSYVKKAKKILRNNPLNGVVFPEYALDEPLFDEICKEIKGIEPRLEFAITGSSSNCDNEFANFVLTALWGDATAKAPKYLLTSRRKHHRWKLSPDQVRTYDLEKVLPPPTSWWETHSIAQREIHLFHFRKTSVFTSMICEDLARSDPCHDILRAIGPNLVFALLMDGPQLNARWPGRYAATLADDPGTSVLSVTSMGLINRTNSTKNFPASRTIALWRDDSGKSRELSLDEGHGGLLLSLVAESAHDQTLDGRTKKDAWSWRYDTHRSLGA